MKAADNTKAHITMTTSSPANVSSWFKTSLAGATVLKMLLIAWIMDAKSFLAIQIMKNVSTMFTPETENPDESRSM